jgi:hypothetical protein
MQIRLPILAVLILVTPYLRAAESAAIPEPGPEDGGLRMRLVVVPRTDLSEEGFDVRVDLLNTSGRAMTLRAGWRNDDPGDVKAYIEAAIGIECVPAVVPWSGGVPEIRRRLPQPEYLFKAGEVLSVRWQTKGRHLKNRVTDANEVQNPEFPFPGLYSVHASLDVITSERVVTLRSNEQLVPVGGSRAMPRYTFGHLLVVDAGGKTAVLDLGSRQKVESGDQFMHFSKQTPWKLTVTKVSPGHSWGHIELLSPKTERPPIPGMGATLMTKE